MIQDNIILTLVLYYYNICEYPCVVYLYACFVCAGMSDGQFT